MKAYKYLQFIFIAIVFSSCGQHNWPGIAVLLKDRKAAQLAEKENFNEALTQYYSVLDEAPENPTVHSNIGVLLKQKAQKEEALKSLNYALELAQSKKHAKVEFSVRFNLGVYYGLLKKIPEALEHYQAALEIIPDSLETKTNIELLLQQQQQQSGGEGDKDDQKDQNKSDQDQKNQDQKQNEGKKESSGKYKPRPFKGDQLSESDVKKILGELKNQEQKIRSNFDKKEKKGKTSKNEKDW